MGYQGSQLRHTHVRPHVSWDNSCALNQILPSTPTYLCTCALAILYSQFPSSLVQRGTILWDVKSCLHLFSSDEIVQDVLTHVTLLSTRSFGSTQVLLVVSTYHTPSLHGAAHTTQLLLKERSVEGEKRHHRRYTETNTTIPKETTPHFYIPKKGVYIHLRLGFGWPGLLHTRLANNRHDLCPVFI